MHKRQKKQKKTIYKFIYILLKETAKNKNKTNKKTSCLGSSC